VQAHELDQALFESARRRPSPTPTSTRRS
jgi:hypothetical protein